MYTFKKMERSIAEKITKWTYEEPFSLYSMDGSEEDVAELLEEPYYYAVNQQGELVGYICYGHSARVPGGYSAGIYEDKHDQGTIVDIGLGLEPNLTGQGFGREFLSAGIFFLQDMLQVSRFRLVVAAFNDRAIKVYEREGFVQHQEAFYSKVKDQDIAFVCMTLNV